MQLTVEGGERETDKICLEKEKHLKKKEIKIRKDKKGNSKVSEIAGSWSYLARWIQRSVSGGSSLRPRARLEGGSSGTAAGPFSRLSSSSRMPMGCCRLARQLELTAAGCTPNSSLCW